MIGQTRIDSAIESAINVAIGYAVAVASQLMIFPLFDIHIPIADNLAIGAWFTMISIVRGYVIRRYFNARVMGLIADHSRLDADPGNDKA